ncbi:uncharacterized protein [Mobula birostris]|uniref:uncharacterized protein isoform X7 n=1 Tax=Mobula birostris TaxID=1983395 RepID=UPI003B289C75
MKFRAADIQGSLTLILLLGLRAVSAEFSLDCFYKWERDMEASGTDMGDMEASGSAMEDMEASGSAMEELDPIETTTQDTNWRWHLAVSQMVLVFIAAVLIAAVSLRQGGSTCQTPCCCKPTVGRQNPRDMKGPRRNSLELGCIVPPGVYAEHYVYPQLIRLSPDR